MEKHLNKKIEQLSDRLMKDSALEKPSLHFTDAVLQSIQKYKVREVTDYKPLITKQGWMGIGIGFVLMIYLIITNSDPSEAGWLQSINFNKLFDFKFMENLFSMSVSKSVSYTILLFGLMLFVQIPILKNHFNKRLES